MHFRKNVFSIFAATIVLTAFCASQSAAEEEKSLWQRFVDWFKPAPSLEGEGPLYDELRELETQIDRIEGRYSRERRPGNKTRLKKAVAASSSATAADTSKAAKADICAHDTVFVRDTVVIHDTLYVIVSGKPGEQQTPAAQSNTAQPAGEASPADSATATQAIPAADSATIPGNK